MEASLQVKNLTKQYPGFLLDHVSFSLPKGAIMGLIGENGAGKSTTINAILDLIHKDEGRVSFWGRISAEAYRQWDNNLYQNYLTRFQLPLSKPIKSFSKGMKTKLCIAVALSHRPKLLVLDEATSGLDPVIRDDILEVFLDFVQPHVLPHLHRPGKSGRLHHLHPPGQGPLLQEQGRAALSIRHRPLRCRAVCRHCPGGRSGLAAGGIPI